MKETNSLSNDNLSFVERRNHPILCVPVLLIADMAELSTLTKNALNKIGLLTSADLSKLSLNDLKRINLIGKKGRSAIVKYVNDNGMQFNSKSYFNNVQ